MTNGRKLTAAAFAIFATLVGSPAHAAQCGNGAGGFEVWKQQFAGEARAKGVGANAISALMGTRGAPAIVARGRALKRSQAAMFASIEQRYGVPPGPLIAIWGMESGFGRERGNQNILSWIAPLAY